MPPFNQGYPPMGPGGQHHQYGAPNKFGGYLPYMGGYPAQSYPPMYNAYGIPPPLPGKRGAPVSQSTLGAGGLPPSRGSQAGRGVMAPSQMQAPSTVTTAPKETPFANTQQQRQTPPVATVTTQASQPPPPPLESKPDV